MAQFIFRSSMLNGHPGDIARPVKKLIVRGVNHDLIVTATTDGLHAERSWHKIIWRPGDRRNRKGRAVDFGNRQPGTAAARARLVRFQRDMLERFGPGAFLELFGPDNGLCVKNGVRLTLIDGSALEDAHDNHDHCVPVHGRVPLPTPRLLTQPVRDWLLARKAGVPFAFDIVQEGRLVDDTLRMSLCFALIEQESGFRNVWGGDRPPNGDTVGLRFELVTKDRYLTYKRVRGPAGKGGMQGVGLTQLTYFSLQDEADRLGGCWRPRPQLRVGYAHLAALVRVHGDRKGLAIYNGGSAHPNFGYADNVLALARKWHEKLTR